MVTIQGLQLPSDEKDALLARHYQMFRNQEMTVKSMYPVGNITYDPNADSLTFQHVYAGTEKPAFPSHMSSREMQELLGPYRNKKRVIADQIAIVAKDRGITIKRVPLQDYFGKTVGDYVTRYRNWSPSELASNVTAQGLSQLLKELNDERNQLNDSYILLAPPLTDEYRQLLQKAGAGKLPTRLRFNETTEEGVLKHLTTLRLNKMIGTEGIPDYLPLRVVKSL